MKWFTFAQEPAQGSGSVEIRNIATGRRFRADATTLAREVLSAGELPNRLDQSVDRVDSSYDLWREMGWSVSLAYFLSSIDGEYQDTSANYSEEHRKVLTRYAEDDDLPRPQPREGGTISLPEPRLVELPAGATLRRRRSTLVPKPVPLSIEDLSGVMWQSTQRLRAFRDPEIASDPLRAMINFGPATDIYLLVYEIEGLDNGAYWYDMDAHRLVRVNTIPSRDEARQFVVGQPAPLTAAVSVVYVSEVQRQQWRYRHGRALRGLWIDQAKVVNELLWQLAKRSIQPHMTPATGDSALLRALGLPDDLSVLPAYVISFGGGLESAS